MQAIGIYLKLQDRKLVVYFSKVAWTWTVSALEPRAGLMASIASLSLTPFTTVHALDALVLSRWTVFALYSGASCLSARLPKFLSFGNSLCSDYANFTKFTQRSNAFALRRDAISKQATDVRAWSHTNTQMENQMAYAACILSNTWRKTLEYTYNNIIGFYIQHIIGFLSHSDEKNILVEVNVFLCPHNHLKRNIKGSFLLPTKEVV